MSKVVDVAIRRGQFIIKPLKSAHKRRKLGAMQQAYSAWATQNEERCFASEAEIKNQARISIVVPAYNTQANDLLAMIYSVVNQHYENWELILVNASDEAAAKQSIATAIQIDTRIKVVDANNQGIAANTNKGIDAATGQYIAFLDHDDLLHPCALHCMAYAIAQTKAELLYSDEDKIAADSSTYFQPFCKPGWSPDLLRNVNYINHLTVIKTEFVRRAGNLRKDFDGAQDYDLLLRIIDICKPKIVHVPRVLYHWRAAATSTARDFGVKSHVLTAGTHAIQQHLERNKIPGTAKPIAGRPGFYSIDFRPPKSISIVVGPVAAHYRFLCAVWIKEIITQLPPNIAIEWVVGDWYEPFKSGDPERSVKLIDKKETNYWQAVAELVTGETVVCFQSCSLPAASQGLEKIAAVALRLDAIVSPVIVNNSGMVLDAGLVEASYGLQPLFDGYKLGEDSYYGSTEWNRNVASLTAQVFAASKVRFKQLVHYTKGATLGADALKKYNEKDRSCSLLSYAHTPFVYKDELTDPPLMSHEYFNPQLVKAQNGMSMTQSDWGSLKDMSERENDQ